MGNEYDNHHHSIHGNKSVFLPIFCRLSLKDVKVNSSHHHHHHKDRLNSDEPSSPKVSCMGQVKRNSRVIGFPTTATINAAPTNHYKYTKLKKLFSSKTLLPNPPGAAVVGCRSGSRSCRSGGAGDNMVCVVKNSSRKLRVIKSDRFCSNNVNGRECCVENVGEMDPPLPVVKRVAPPRDEANLWKRRFNGAAGGLQSLQIDQIQLPNSKLIQPPTTV